MITTNHVRFVDSYFPYRKQSVIDENVKDRPKNQLWVETPVTCQCEAYNKTSPRSACEKVHCDLVTDDLAKRLVNKPETFVRVNQYQYLTDILQEQRELMAQVAATLEKASSCNSRDSWRYLEGNWLQQTSQELCRCHESWGSTEWMEAYRKEYQGFRDRDAVRVVIPPPWQGAKGLGSTTSTDYKVEQGKRETKSTFICTRGSASVWNQWYILSGIIFSGILRYRWKSD